MVELRCETKFSLNSRKETSQKTFYHKNLHNERSIIEFGKRIFGKMERPEQKFAADMTYGMLASGSCLLTSIVDELHEETKKVNAVERLARHLKEGVP